MHRYFVTSGSRQLLSRARFFAIAGDQNSPILSTKTGTPTGRTKCKPQPPNDFRDEQLKSTRTKRTNPGHQPLSVTNHQPLRAKKAAAV
jgi:hypothetical protein